jgi:glucosamine kinase
MFMNNVTLAPALAGLLPGRLLGIDAGGSATRTVLVSDGRILAQETAEPMNALLTEEIEDKLLRLILRARPDAAGVGMPGLRSTERAALLGQELSRRAKCQVTVTWDGATAWMGAFGGEPGILVLAGTGSGAVGYDGTRWARAGAHGFLLGDEGGAYWIGRAAVNAALRFNDGMGGSAAIRRAVTQAAECDLDTLVRRVHAHPASRGLLAGFAPVVTELAATDDVAARIVRRAVRQLAGLAAAVRRRLGPLPVSGIGGVLRAPLVWEGFAELTGAAPPLAQPELGAALLATRPATGPAAGPATGPAAGPATGPAAGPATGPEHPRWPSGATPGVADGSSAPSSVADGSSARSGSADG